MPQERSGEIELGELQLVLEKLLDHIRITRGIPSITLQSDFYWKIPSDRVYDMGVRIDEPSINVGSLYDDWEMVRKFVLIEDLPLSANLAMISTRLRYVGETIAELTAPEGG